MWANTSCTGFFSWKLCLVKIGVQRGSSNWFYGVFFYNVTTSIAHILANIRNTSSAALERRFHSNRASYEQPPALKPVAPSCNQGPIEISLLRSVNVIFLAFTQSNTNSFELSSLYWHNLCWHLVRCEDYFFMWQFIMVKFVMLLLFIYWIYLFVCFCLLGFGGF